MYVDKEFVQSITQLFSISTFTPPRCERTEDRQNSLSCTLYMYTVFHKKTNLAVFLITQLSLAQFQSNFKRRWPNSI
jgi:hypothetical protein